MHRNTISSRAQRESTQENLSAGSLHAPPWPYCRTAADARGSGCPGRAPPPPRVPPGPPPRPTRGIGQLMWEKGSWRAKTCEIVCKCDIDQTRYVWNSAPLTQVHVRHRGEVPEHAHRPLHALHRRALLENHTGDGHQHTAAGPQLALDALRVGRYGRPLRAAGRAQRGHGAAQGERSVPPAPPERQGDAKHPYKHPPSTHNPDKKDEFWCDGILKGTTMETCT